MQHASASCSGTHFTQSHVHTFFKKTGRQPRLVASLWAGNMTHSTEKCPVDRKLRYRYIRDKPLGHISNTQRVRDHSGGTNAERKTGAMQAVQNEITHAQPHGKRKKKKKKKKIHQFIEGCTRNRLMQEGERVEAVPASDKPENWTTTTTTTTKDMRRAPSQSHGPAAEMAPCTVCTL